MQLDTALHLIQVQGTLEQVGEFLKARQLEHSAGSWRDMIDRRLKPMIESGKLKPNDVLELLRETEENGNQHVLLYDILPGKNTNALFATDLRKKLQSLKDFPDVDDPQIIDMPETPTIVEVREERYNGENTIVAKIVEKRVAQRRASAEVRGTQYVVTYDQSPYRAVNVVRYFERGFAEVRIFSHQEAVSYSGQADGLLKKLAPLASPFVWRPYYLNNLKNAFWDATQRETIKARFGLRHSQHRNADGSKLSAAVVNSQMSMFDDPSLLQGIDGFNSARNDVDCDRASITVKPLNGSNFRPVNVVLHGDTNGSPNEFSIGSRLTRDEYEHVLSTILEFNEKR
ncbi:hypothetical protein [Ensifer adhaerens]|uniref:hypothetical protein n=1 Tax=Ensifer adhaerens TaxID=106592 RepID=UPI001C4E1971|nr:hypothetical protein [Ensifer adhaerens]MBW0370579.1 hypothetical protein [Ensifer adhaerens]UCM21599.1 hypothetical protein LDL63_08485 [Ensifer adhaerens]